MGSRGVTAGWASNLSLTFSPDQNFPWFAYSDQAFNNKGSVLYFDGTAWNYAGDPGFTGECANSTRPAAALVHAPACHERSLCDWGHVRYHRNI